MIAFATGAETIHARAIDLRTVRGMPPAWIITVPLAAGLTLTGYGLLTALGV